MFQQVSIRDGKLLIGMLEFQVYDEADNPVDNLTYRGEVIMQENKFRICQSPTVVHDFYVAPKPTKASVDYAEGYEKALSQKRRREPKDKSSHFYFGWLDGWKSKRQSGD